VFGTEIRGNEPVQGGSAMNLLGLIGVVVVAMVALAVVARLAANDVMGQDRAELHRTGPG
jgi:hypothetical protein